MSDIRCTVCGKPWDYHHLRQDAPPWVWPLFKAGAGCESCEGVVPPSGPLKIEMFEDIECGDLDPQIRINASLAFAEGKTPKWKRPEDIVLWACDGCGITAYQNVDFNPKKSPDLAYEWRVPHNAKRRKWYSSHPFPSDYPDPEPAHVFKDHQKGGSSVCEACLQHCRDCGAPLSGELEHDDVYSEGNPFHLEGEYHKSDSLCVECYEKYCTKCQEQCCSCLSDTLREVCRPFDFDEDPELEEVHNWLHDRGKPTWGEEVKPSDILEALHALEYIEYVDEEDKEKKE